MKFGITSARVIKNTFIQSGGKFISTALGFITVGLLTRYLGSSGYGNFTLIFSYLAFFGVISDFGMQLAIVKELSNKQNETTNLYGTYFWIKLLMVFISSLLAMLVLFFFSYPLQLKLSILIGVVAISISGMMGYFTAIFQARVRLDLITFVDVITRLVTVCAVIFFVLLKCNFYFIVSSVLIGNIIGLLTSIYILRDAISFHFDRSLAKRLAILSIPIGITSFVSTLYFKVDVIILSLYKNSGDVGIYSLAYKVLENIIVFWGFYMASTYPLMARFKYEDRKKYYSILRKSILIALVGSIPLIAALFYLSPIVIFIFGGREFTGAVGSFRILLFSIPVLFINGILYNFYIIERKNLITLIAMIVALLVNLWMNIIYIPLYSYTAASYITVASAGVLLICYSIGVKFIERVREV